MRETSATQGRAARRAAAAAALAPALTLALALALGGPAWACPLPAAEAGDMHIVQGELQLAWEPLPKRLAVGQPFALALRVCPRTARLLRVDATMPEHRHGMNYRPTLEPLGEGRWRAEGLLWHMAGRWELAIEVENGGQRQWLRQSVVLR